MTFRRAIYAALLLILSAGSALAGTIYIDTAANGSAAANYSGSTDTTTPTVSGTVATASASDVILDAGTDLSGVITTAGATQSSIYLTGATNTNKAIFWITAVAGSGGATPTVTVDTAPTCAANACGVWNIGGRAILTNAKQEGALRAGDTVIFNTSPAVQSGTSWTFRLAGDTTTGYAKIKGKSGSRPVLTTNGSNNPTISSAVVLSWIENLEIKQTHATLGNGINLTAAGAVVYNVKVSATPAIGISISTATNARVINSEITGAGGDGLTVGVIGYFSGDYIHDNTGDCFEQSATASGTVLSNDVFDTCGARGIFFSGASPSTYVNPGIINNVTVYGNGNSGLEVTDADTALVVTNSIFSTNGDAAGEYNAEWSAGTAEMASFHNHNTFYHANCQGSNTGGPACVSGLTLNAQVAASELSTDPLLTSPAAGDFSLQALSPAKAAGFPGALLGATGQGYMDFGAQQIQAGSAGGNGIIGVGM